MYNYFAPEEFKNFPRRPRPVQAYLLEFLQRTLNTIRGTIDSPIRITDCYRTLKKYESLKKRGYFPSATSDHFWAQVIPTIKKQNKIKYGPYFIYSAGAVDFVTPRFDINKCYDTIRKLHRRGTIKIGQAILESGGGRRPWIHLSNPRQLIFTSDLLYRVGAVKNTFLISTDGGKTYKRAA